LHFNEYYRDRYLWGNRQLLSLFTHKKLPFPNIPVKSTVLNSLRLREIFYLNQLNHFCSAEMELLTNSSISPGSGMDLSAPFLVVTMEAAAEAVVSITLTPSRFRVSTGWSRR
jgi:hypothetical protein